MRLSSKLNNTTTINSPLTTTNRETGHCLNRQRFCCVLVRKLCFILYSCLFRAWLNQTYSICATKKFYRIIVLPFFLNIFQIKFITAACFLLRMQSKTRVNIQPNSQDEVKKKYKTKYIRKLQPSKHVKCVPCAATNANQNKTDKRQKQHETHKKNWKAQTRCV